MRFSDAQRLTRDGKLKFAPVFSGPDEVVYVVHEAPNQVVLQRVRLPHGAPERVHPGMAEHQLDPAYSADGRYHAFVRSASSPQLLLILQDLKEKREARVVPQDARAVARCPTIAPRGDRVAFHLSDSGGQQIASTDLRPESTRRDLRRLTAASGIYGWPRYSPDGRQIAFASSMHGDFEIYVMDADGANLRRLTRSPGLDIRPAWSPDGTCIAFTSNRDGRYEIYVMDRDGGGTRRVTDHPERDDYALWYPDGRSLLTVSERAGRFDLYRHPLPE